MSEEKTQVDDIDRSVYDVIDEERLTVLLCHEMFHCLTRCNPEFREEMYSLINFTVVDHDFELPEAEVVVTYNGAIDVVLSVISFGDGLGIDAQ